MRPAERQALLDGLCRRRRPAHEWSDCWLKASQRAISRLSPLRMIRRGMATLPGSPPTDRGRGSCHPLPALPRPDRADRTDPRRRERGLPLLSFDLPAGAGVTAHWVPNRDRRLLGRFELIESVGAGAFGTVYKARDSQLDRVVAVKVPRAGSLATDDDRNRFLREARSVAQLQHPAIVPVHDVGQVNGIAYLVSEFVQGVALADRLTAGPPSYRERPGSSPWWPRRWTTPTSRAWSTGTSSPPISCSATMALPSSPTSAWPSARPARSR